jgi:hypothetical protein
MRTRSTTTTAPRYVSRARFSASDRPIPPAFVIEAIVGARRANRSPTVDTRGAPTAPWARWLESLAARLAGVRRAASLALALMLATGAGDEAGGATHGARS